MAERSISAQMRSLLMIRKFLKKRVQNIEDPGPAIEPRICPAAEARESRDKKYLTENL
jgi:hypothetical protein